MSKQDHIISPSLLIANDFFTERIRNDDDDDDEDKELSKTFMKIYNISNDNFEGRQKYNSVYDSAGILLEKTLYIKDKPERTSTDYEELCGYVQTFDDMHDFLSSFDVNIFLNKSDGSDGNDKSKNNLFGSFKYYPNICDAIMKNGPSSNRSSSYTKELFMTSNCHFLGYGIFFDDRSSIIVDSNSKRVLGSLIPKSSGNEIYSFVSDVLSSDFFKNNVIKKGERLVGRSDKSKCSGLEDIYNDKRSKEDLLIDFSKNHIVFINRHQIRDFVNDHISNVDLKLSENENIALRLFNTACSILCDNLCFSMYVISESKYKKTGRGFMFNLEGSDLFSNCPLKSIFLIVGLAWNEISSYSVFDNIIKKGSGLDYWDDIVKISKSMCQITDNVGRGTSVPLKQILNCLSFVRCNDCKSAAKTNKLSGIRKDRNRILSNSFIRRFRSDNVDMKTYDAILFNNGVKKTNPKRGFQLQSWKIKMSEICDENTIKSDGKNHLFVPSKSNCLKQIDNCVEKHLSIYGSIIIWPMVALLKILDDSVDNSSSNFTINNSNDVSSSSSIVVDVKNKISLGAKSIKHLEKPSKFIDVDNKRVVSNVKRAPFPLHIPSLRDEIMSPPKRRPKKILKTKSNAPSVSKSKSKLNLTKNQITSAVLTHSINKNRDMIESILKQQTAMISLMTEIRDKMNSKKEEINDKKNDNDVTLQRTSLIKEIVKEFDIRTNQLLDKVQRDEDKRESEAMNFIDNLCKGVTSTTSDRKRKRRGDDDEEKNDQQDLDTNLIIPSSSKRKIKNVKRYEDSTSCDDDFTDDDLDDIDDDDDSSSSFNLELDNDSDSDFEITDDNQYDEDDENNNTTTTIGFNSNDNVKRNKLNNDDSKTDPSTSNFVSSVVKKSDICKPSIKSHIYTSKSSDEPKHNESKNVFIFENVDFENQFLLDDEDDDDDNNDTISSNDNKRAVLDKFTKCKMGNCCLSNFPKEQMNDDDSGDENSDRLFPQGMPYGYILPSSNEDIDILWEDGLQISLFFTTLETKLLVDGSVLESSLFNLFLFTLSFELKPIVVVVLLFSSSSSY